LEKNLDKIVWIYLSRNPNAIALLEKNLNKIVWGQLSSNPNVIQTQYISWKRIQIKFIGINYLATQPFLLMTTKPSRNVAASSKKT